VQGRGLRVLGKSGGSGGPFLLGEVGGEAIVSGVGGGYV
jgi:hypothetical protein